MSTVSSLRRFHRIINYQIVAALGQRKIKSLMDSGAAAYRLRAFCQRNRRRSTGRNRPTSISVISEITTTVQANT